MAQAHHKRHHHASPAYVDAFIAKVLPDAKSTKKKWGVPIAVLIAQAAQETGWGRHVIDNAYFGIKGKAPDGSSVDFGTSEVVNGKVIHEKDAFRAYTGLADAADDYGRFLNQNTRYRAAFRFKDDPDKFVQAIAQAGYATDPNYAKALISIIHSHNLAQYDK